MKKFLQPSDAFIYNERDTENHVACAAVVTTDALLFGNAVLPRLAGDEPLLPLAGKRVLAD
jgi:hypothetical protein